MFREGGMAYVRKECEGHDNRLKIRLALEAQKLAKLHEASPNHFPRPTDVREEGFTLPFLTINPKRASQVQREVLLLMRDTVWKEVLPARRFLSQGELVRNLARFLVGRGDSFLVTRLGKFAAQFDHREFFHDTTLIHGDPTMENTLFLGKSFVLIDPVPDDVKIPRNKYVDLGKMLQSAFGYEKIKYEPLAVYDYEPDDQVDMLLREIHQGYGAAGVEYSLFWAAVNFHRILHRFNGDRVHYEREMDGDYTTDLHTLQKWMESRIKIIHLMLVAVSE